MSTQSSTSTSTAASQKQASTMQSYQAIAEYSRQQTAISAEIMATVLSATAAVQQAQQQLAQRTALRYQQAAQMLRDSTNPADMLAVQFDLMTSGLQEASRYWQQLGAAASRTQSAAGSPLAKEASAASAGLGPMFQAWQSMFVPPPNGAAQAH